MHGSSWLSKKEGGTVACNRLSSQKLLDGFCLLSVIFLSGLWAVLTFDKLAVISEGWYVTYSNLILAGKIPYLDFEIVFPPLYMYLMTVVTIVFGESLLAFRFIGVLVYICITALAYFIFKQISPSWIAAIAAIIASFALQSENTFIGYDYIRFYDLFNYFALFLLLRVVVKSQKNEPISKNLNMFFIGILIALAILVRQTSGLMIFVYVVVFLVLLHFLFKNVKFEPKNFCCFLVGFSLPLLIVFLWLLHMGVLGSFIDMTILSGTKGSVTAMLFNWIPRLSSSLMVFEKNLITAMVLFLILLVIIEKTQDGNESINENRATHLVYFASVVTMATLVIVLFQSYNTSLMVSSHWLLLTNVMFVFNTVLILILMCIISYKNWKKTQPPNLEIACLLISGFVFILGFGSGTSGGLSLGQGALNFGLVAAIFLNYIARIPEKKFKAGLKTLAVVLVIGFVATSISIKVITPYNWWGVNAEPYEDAVYETEIDYFDGIKLTANEKYMYEDFVEKTKIHLGTGDEIYCYSQIPIFYTLANKIPTVKAPVCWFDVVQDKTVLEDLAYLKSDNPKMIVFADHGYSAMEVHEHLFRGGNESGQRAMYEWLLECKDDTNSDYIVISSYNINGYNVYLMLHK